MFGNARIEYLSFDQTNRVNPSNNDQPGKIKSKDWAAYKYIDFAACAKSVTVSVAPGVKPGQILFRLDNLWGPRIGTLNVPGGGDRKTFTALTADIKPVKGIHALMLEFSVGDDDMTHADWFDFDK